jgi:hypothetical protein
MSMRLLLIPALLVYSSLSLAQETASVSTEPYSASATVGWIPGFDLDSGGTASAIIWQASFSGNWKLDDAQRLGFSLQYGQQDWSFDDPQAWGVATPWQTLSRVAVSVPYSHVNTKTGWAYTLIPGLDFARERDASSSDSFSYGLNAGVARFLDKDRMIGGGVAVWQRLDGFQAFPYVAVNWKLSEHWKIANPFQVSVVGPAGLEAVWMPVNNFEMGFGATWREFQYRLAANNPVAPNGILVDSTIPVYMRAETKFSDAARLNLYLGAGVGGEFEFLDENENTVSTESHSLMPLIGLTFTGKF